MKVGDYVRTNKRNEKVIRKVVNIFETPEKDHQMVFDKPTKYIYFVEDGKDYISKTNPIDLIQVGDYVNGSRVLDIYINLRKEKTLLVQTEYKENINATATNDEPLFIEKPCLINQDIKSIVTKEQFEKEMYVLESEVN